MLVDVCSENCSKCVYSTWLSLLFGCGYILVEGHSRTFENGVVTELAKQGKCDKFISKTNVYEYERVDGIKKCRNSIITPSK